jgi:hypothetical protein
LLGVRRTTVTLVVGKLRASGAVQSARRGLVEIDRPRLEEAACECYEVTHRLPPCFPSYFILQLSVRSPVGWIAPPADGSALQPIQAASLVSLIQMTFCRTLVTLCLTGSAVSVATF